MRKKITFLFILLLSGISVALAQNITVKGTVSDKTGVGLQGVSVSIKGTQAGTETDANGNYSINAPGNATLRFSFIGFETQEVSVNNQTNIKVSLKDNTTGLDEVVVVGYGTQKKIQVTGAISHVSAADLQNQQITRFDQALQGRAAGVTVTQQTGSPGAQPTVLIRGVGSINNPSPLYVVDGVVLANGGLENIDPNNIASIDVLKDASAAIYGSRASNGVVLVTTKKGKTGAPQLNYDMYIGSQDVMHKVPLTNAVQYQTLRNEALTNDGGAALFPNPSAATTNTNWQNEIFSNALIQNHSLSLSGASDKANYYTAFGYFDQDGIVDPSISNFKRYTFTVNTSYKIRKWLTIGENFDYAYIRNQNLPNANNTFGAPLASALNLDPLTPVVITDPSVTYPAYSIRNSAGQLYGISQYVNQEMTNPLAFLQTKLGNYNWAHNLLGNAFLEITPIDGLVLRTQIGGKQAFYGEEDYNPLYYLDAAQSNTTNSNGYRTNNRNFTWNWDNTASYTREFGKNHLTALIGTSAESQSGMTLNGTFNQLPITSYTQLSFNYSLPAANRIAGASDDQPYNLASYFGRVTYDYDGKYLLSGVYRRDGSSKFGSNNVWGSFPSGELGWIISKEDFFPKGSFVDFLKLRGSYGAVGNEMSLGAFQYVSIVSGGQNYVVGPDGLIIGNSTASPANPDLKWESTHTADIGFDAILFRNFNVTFDVYRKLTVGMLEQPTLPGYTGYTQSPWANVGNMENKGIELELGYNQKFGDFNMNLSGNIAYNHNEVTSLGTTAFYDVGAWQGSAGFVPERIAVGHQVDAFYGFQKLGIFKSQTEINAYTHNGTLIQPNAKPGDIKWADLNNDGAIDGSDRTFLGDPIPHFTYGLTLNLSYKAFDLNAFGQGVWGNKIFDATRRLDIPAANYQIAALNAWTPQNSGSDYPRLSNTDPNHNFSYPSTQELQSGAYFRLKTLQIGYTLPKSLLSKAEINKVRVFVSAYNLFTITKYTGYDPEIGLSDVSNAKSGLGIDYGVYPQARALEVGIDVTL